MTKVGTPKIGGTVSKVPGTFVVAMVAVWERPFRVWHFSVSYNQLLLCSLSEDTSPVRVDVLFSNVCFLQMSTKCTRLEIHTGEGCDPPGVEIPAGTRGEWFTRNAGEGYVFATHCQWHEDEGNAMTPSRFGPSNERTEVTIAVVLGRS
ncbi:hypothetical protein [Streptomyces sp. TRM70350]|uniref:hypothetical protein n=1 Tax=Streptomyces sp. TRM70350 TaxID=2856165 RepID=UPI001C438C11|nr:hypothetical protein [Streptomyces sp. TRM70350]MBV7699224.1 hypothetical protein [Streptomyces sp. TRM70350]